MEPVPARPVKDVFCDCQSLKLGYDTSHTEALRASARSHMMTSDCWSATGSGRSRTA